MFEWLFGNEEAKRPAEDHPEAPAAKRAKLVTLDARDLLIVQQSEGKVLCFSNVIAQAPPEKAALKVVSWIGEKGGKYVLLEKDGSMSHLSKSEATKLVASARKAGVQITSATAKSPASKASNSSTISSYPDTPAKGAANASKNPAAKKRVEVGDEESLDDEDHPALNLEGSALAKSSPCKSVKYPDLGGSGFKPALSLTSLKTFVVRAKKLKNKSEFNLFKLVDLDDAEDAVHLYRNFFDYDPDLIEEKAGRNGQAQICFSSREIDIMCYAQLHGIDRDYVWQLMSYRVRRTVLDKFHVTGVMGKIQTLLDNKKYVKHLEKNVAILFDGEEGS